MGMFLVPLGPRWTLFTRDGMCRAETGATTVYLQRKIRSRPRHDVVGDRLSPDKVIARIVTRHQKAA